MDLQKLGRRELQSLAKEYGIKANISNAALIEEIERQKATENIANSVDSTTDQHTQSLLQSSDRFLVADCVIVKSLNSEGIVKRVNKNSLRIIFPDGSEKTVQLNDCQKKCASISDQTIDSQEAPIVEVAQNSVENSNFHDNDLPNSTSDTPRRTSEGTNSTTSILPAPSPPPLARSPSLKRKSFCVGSTPTAVSTNNVQAPVIPVPEKIRRVTVASRRASTAATAPNDRSAHSALKSLQQQRRNTTFSAAATPHALNLGKSAHLHPASSSVANKKPPFSASASTSHKKQVVPRSGPSSKAVPSAAANWSASIGPSQRKPSVPVSVPLSRSIPPASRPTARARVHPTTGTRKPFVTSQSLATAKVADRGMPEATSLSGLLRDEDRGTDSKEASKENDSFQRNAVPASSSSQCPQLKATMRRSGAINIDNAARKPSAASADLQGSTIGTYYSSNNDSFLAMIQLSAGRRKRTPLPRHLARRAPPLRICCGEGWPEQMDGRTDRMQREASQRLHILILWDILYANYLIVQRIFHLFSLTKMHLP